MRMKKAACVAAVCLLAGAGTRAAEVSCASMTVTLDEKSKGAVTRMVTAHGAELSPDAGTTPLFLLKFTRADDFLKSDTVTSAEASRCAAERTGDGVRLTYEGFGGHACVERVVCTARGADARVRWGISVTAAPGWALEETTYPRLLVASALGSDGGDDRYVLGSAKGGVTYNPGAKKTGWMQYANQPGALAAQFAAVYDDRAGLYFAAEDGAGYWKLIGAERLKEGGLVTSRRRGFETGAVTQAYELVTAGFEGTPAEPCTWHDAADLYKKWAVTQRWARTWFKDRADVPAWLRAAPVMTRFHRDWIGRPEDVRAWLAEYWKKEFPEAPLVAALWGWEKIGTWITPDYFPCWPDDAAFTKLVADLRAAGAHAFPWPSGYHWTTTYDKRADGTFAWDDRARFARVAEAHAVFERSGKRYNRVPFWLRGGDTACLCGGEKWTRDWWNNEICLPLARRGCEMIQVDQVVGGAFPACWSRAHSHAPGDGLWKTEVFLDQLVTMRAAMRTAQADAVVCVEEPNEMYNHLAGIQDYRDCESRADEWASVFNYLYHEYLPCFQSNPKRGNRIWQAHAAADGQIPFLTVAESDLSRERGAAIVNASFEASADGRARGWEKLSGYKGVAWNGRMFIDRAEKHSGEASVRLECTAAETAVQVSQNVGLQDAAFVPGRTYRLSAWIKTGHSARANSVNACFLGGGRGHPGISLPLPAPEAGWTRVARDFKLPAGPDTLRIMLHLNGDAACWVDDLAIEEVLADGTARAVTRTGRGAYDLFMRRWVELYHGAARKWLAHGRQVKPPRLVCARQPYTMTSHAGTFTGTRACVFCNAYVAADGTKATVLANATAEAQPVTLYDGGKKISLTLAPDEIRVLE